VLKAKLLDKKPDIVYKYKKASKGLSVEEINSAIENLGLKYKRVDELDIYNIFSYIKETQKG